MTGLWEVNGAYWTLPIRAEKVEEGVAEITPGAGVFLLDKQTDVLLEALKPVTWDANGLLFCSIKDLTTFAVSSRETDPQAIVQWFPRTQYAASKDDLSWDEEEFLKRFVMSGWASDPMTAAVYWRAFRKCMFRWLVVEGKVLDLGFARLCMVPFRSNWKESLLGFLGADWMDVTYPDVKEQAMKLLGHPELLATWHNNPDRIIHSVEVVCKKSFMMQIHRIEKERRKTQNFHYWRSVGNRMADVRDFAYEALCQTVAQIRRPYPFASGLDTSGRTDLPRGWREMDFNLASAREPRLLPVAADRYTGLEQERFISRLDPKAPGVRQVPDI